VRSHTLAASMSDYLIKSIEGTPNIDIRFETEIANCGGDGRLEWVDFKERTERASPDHSPDRVRSGSATEPAASLDASGRTACPGQRRVDEDKALPACREEGYKGVPAGPRAVVVMAMMVFYQAKRSARRASAGSGVELPKRTSVTPGLLPVRRPTDGLRSV